MPHSMSVQMWSSVGRVDSRPSALDRAMALYVHARNRGQRGGLGCVLGGRPRCLLSLADIDTSGDLRTRSCEDIQTVPLSQIRGSEGRSGDFDRDFNPLQDRCRQRWLNVAMARQRGKALPPVELIQVGQVYFVRDGHHRISVARALGQQAIEARVLVWQVAEPLPWEAPATPQERGWGQRLQAVLAGLACIWLSWRGHGREIAPA